MCKDKVLLVGNGINYNKNYYDWNKLIEDLLKKFWKKPNRQPFNYENFPLLYEQIYRKKDKKNIELITEISELIGENIKNSNSNHTLIANSGFNKIVTTNYDYCLEKSINGEIPEKKSYDKTKHVKLFLEENLNCQSKNDNKIWHIHGEVNIPESIVLGYVNYFLYGRIIGNYIDGIKIEESANKKELVKFASIGEKAKAFQENKAKNRYEKTYGKGNVEFIENSWLDIVMKYDTYILGLTLDYVETDLWAILSYRSFKEGKREEDKNKNKPFFSNKIYYCYRAVTSDKRTPYVQCSCQLKPFETRLNALKNLGVNLMPIHVVDWDKYYEYALEEIKTHDNNKS